MKINGYSLLALLILILTGCSVDRTAMQMATPTATVGKTEIKTSLCNEEHPENTVGLRLCREEVYPGYTLFAPLLVPKAYLIDHLGRTVHEWDLKQKPAGIVKLLDTGLLLTTGRPPGEHPKFDNGGPNIGGFFRFLDWDSNVVWEYKYFSEEHHAHHDALMMPNGNLLIVSWEPKTKEAAIAKGRNPNWFNKRNMMMPDHLIEVKPLKEGGEIVWEWHAWDHLVQNLDPSKPNYGEPRDHPELIDINYPPKDISPSWNHVNGIDYNPKLDQIILSALRFNEFWIIDHSTTTVEAAAHSGGKWGKGGDLLYRWGNPQAYGAGTEKDRVFYEQHNAYWIGDGLPGAGNILVFNNGRKRSSGEYSTVVEIKPAYDSNGKYVMNDRRYAPDGLFWSYKADNPTDFFAEKISGAQRLPNGNTLICSGMSGTFFEVTTDGKKVWEYVNPAEANRILAQGERPMLNDPKRDSMLKNAVFRATRIPLDHEGLKARNLAPKGFIERAAGSK